MITIGFGLFVTGFLVAGLLFFAVLWLYYDRRDHNYYDRQRIHHVHHCVKCGSLYVTREGGQGEECPDCGFENAPLRF